LDVTARLGVDEDQMLKLRGLVEAEAPNEHIYHFIGRYAMPGATKTSDQGTEDEIEMGELNKSEPGSSERKVFPLGNDQLLLKGSQLRNTDSVYGLVVYAGRGKHTAHLRHDNTRHTP
jgi:hypothetical protein